MKKYDVSNLNLFWFATATYKATVFGDILLPNTIDIMVISIVFIAIWVVTKLLRLTVFKKNRATHS